MTLTTIALYLITKVLPIILLMLTPLALGEYASWRRKCLYKKYGVQ